MMRRLLKLERATERLEVREAMGKRTAEVGRTRLIPHLAGMGYPRGIWVGNLNWANYSQYVSYSGTPLLGYGSGDIFYVDFVRASSQYMYHADNANFDITGTESWIASADRGLTLGGWFWLNSGASSSNAYGLITKNGDSGQRAYGLYFINAAGNPLCMLTSVDGTATVSATHTTSTTQGAWHFCVGRFDPSTEIKLWIDGVTFTNTTSIPASLFNSTAQLRVGAFDQTAPHYLDGRMAITFIYPHIVPDDLIDEYFDITRGVFGV
jgi:hypothetical protein